MKVGSPRQFGWLRGIVAVTLILNLADAILTIVWVTADLAEEANPVMDWFLGFGTVPFAVAKIAIVSLGSYVLWRTRRRSLAVIGIFLMFMAYYFILLYHLSAMNMDMLQRWM
jgi:hypothetical protein